MFDSIFGGGRIDSNFFIFKLNFVDFVHKTFWLKTHEYIHVIK